MTDLSKRRNEIEGIVVSWSIREHGSGQAQKKRTDPPFKHVHWIPGILISTQQQRVGAKCLESIKAPPYNGSTPLLGRSEQGCGRSGEKKRWQRKGVFVKSGFPLVEEAYGSVLWDAQPSESQSCFLENQSFEQTAAVMSSVRDSLCRDVEAVEYDCNTATFEPIRMLKVF